MAGGKEVMATNHVADRYKGKTAVVTGGASGIGLAITRRLLEEGAAVVVADINEASLAQVNSEFGDRIEGIRVDVRREADVEAMVAAAVRRFGGLDAGFNAAGLGGGGLITDMTEEAWDLTVDVCLKGAFFSVKHEARQMMAQGRGGAIVNISSLNSHVPMFGGAAYTCAKAGVEMLGKNAALELGEHKIRVNTISPGLTATPLTAGITQLPGATEAYLERIPLGRVGQPEDIAAAATFLGSDDAGYVSGTNLFVDGAWEWTGYPDLRPFLAAMQAGAASRS
jgi:meso-butanediol dehydrogenase/(S,S)-butanediol dehydrogenase/diacetyl reductase